MTQRTTPPRRDLRRLIVPAATWLAALTLMATWGVVNTQNSIVPDRIGLFAELMNSPLVLVLPVFAVLFGTLGMVWDTHHRGLSRLWPRLDMRRYLIRRMMCDAGSTFVAFVALALIVLGFALWMWPALQPQLLDPAGYGFDPAMIAQERGAEFNFGVLYAYGEGAVGLMIALLFGAQAAFYVLLSESVLLLTGRAFIALSIPLIVHILESIVVSLLGAPTLALMYISVPFTLERTTEAAPLIMLGILGAAAIALAAVVTTRRHQLSTLA